MTNDQVWKEVGSITIAGVTYKAKDVRLGQMVKNEVYAQKQNAAWGKFIETGADEDFTKADEWWMRRVLLFFDNEKGYLPDLSLGNLPVALEAQDIINEKKIRRDEILKQIEELREASVVEISLAGEDKKAHEAALKNFQSKSKVLQAEFQKFVVKSTQQEIESFFEQLVMETKSG